MKKRNGIVIVGLLLLGLFAWLRWFRPQQRASAPQATAITAPRTEIQTQPSLGASRTVSDEDLKQTPLKGSDEEKRVLIAKIREVMRDANQPITFYGQVIDQDNRPIPGVSVRLGVRYTEEVLPGLTDDRFHYFDEVSDAQGLFGLTNTKGAVLSVKTLEKEGYEMSPRAANQSFWYWRDVPSHGYKADEGHPEVFRMWKKSGSQPLVRKGISAPLHYDGTPSTFDLLSGRATNSGDLRVTLVRNPMQIVYGQHNYEWTLTIESLGGGLVASNDEQMYRAPDAGYTSQIVFHMPADAREWSDEKSVNLYLKLHNGQQYGRAEVKVLVGSDRETTPLYITSFVNPSGSKNLEYDPAQSSTKSAVANGPARP